MLEVDSMRKRFAAGLPGILAVGFAGSTAVGWAFYGGYSTSVRNIAGHG